MNAVFHCCFRVCVDSALVAGKKRHRHDQRRQQVKWEMGEASLLLLTLSYVLLLRVILNLTTGRREHTSLAGRPVHLVWFRFVSLGIDRRDEQQDKAKK